MHLRSLTLKGFKSFASPTTLQFEPGVTAVVGHNGSGKSNIADALSWVMGEQGAKSLRGAKMDDVIFAGTSKRAALGRAEVTLVIDNSDGALPIEYTEVAITRRMYRDGGGEYLINGDPCRLMDVQELLSDSGIGSQMHVIVGQNKLATMLSARPHQWRELIEEAAGVHKHRKRKDRALRKLDSTSADLTRVTDLVTELRRQLTPLGRQAEAAKKAHQASATLRDARRRLAVAKLTQATAIAQTKAVFAEQSAHEQALALGELDAVLLVSGAQDTALQTLRSAVGRAQDQAQRLHLLLERVRATARVAEERVRQLGKDSVSPARDTDLLRQRAEIKQLHHTIEELLFAARAELESVEELERRAKERAQNAHSECEAAEQELNRARAQVAKIAAQLASSEGRAQTLREEAENARVASDNAQLRAEKARSDTGDLEQLHRERESHWQNARVRADEVGRVEALLADKVEKEVRAESGLKERKSALTARNEALETMVVPTDGAAWLLTHAPSSPTAVMADRIKPHKGYERAVTAALGVFTEAVLWESQSAAHRASAALNEAEMGHAVLVYPPESSDSHEQRLSTFATKKLPTGARALIDVIEAQKEIHSTLALLLHHVVVVESSVEVEAVLSEVPQAHVVTREGELYGYGWHVTGATSQVAVLDIRAQILDSQEEIAKIDRELAAIHASLENSRRELTKARQLREEARAVFMEATTDRAVAGESLNRSVSYRETLLHEVNSAAQRADSLIQQATHLESLIAVTLQEQDSAVKSVENLSVRREELSRQREHTHSEWLAAQSDRGRAASEAIALRERLIAAEARVTELDEREKQVLAEQERAVRRERARRRADATCVLAQLLADRIFQSYEAALGRQETLRRSSEEQLTAAKAAQEKVKKARETLAKAEHVTHAAQLDALTAGERAKATETEIVERLGMMPSDLLEEFSGEDLDTFDRDFWADKVHTAEREIAALGQVNPLALEEFTALEERHAFLVTQLDDITRARKDLLDVIKGVDDLVINVIKEAFEDVSTQFRSVFKILFPGGEGSLELTEPHSFLTTGIEIKARPAGKKVQRLSLLSGGEQSLTALAVLIAIFKARPSPFYIFDEVEAALDDVNLRRLLEIIQELSHSAQLILITHQRPTMEIADALYGMSMQGDGVTHVVSQRVGY